MKLDVTEKQQLHNLIKDNQFNETEQNRILQELEALATAPAEKFQTLRNWRKELLDDIHSKQKMLDKVDYCIYKLKK